MKKVEHASRKRPLAFLLSLITCTSIPCISSAFSLAMVDNPKRILLTGASGYLGQHVLYEMLTQRASDLGPFHVYAIYGSKKDFVDAVQKKMTGVSNVTVDSFDITDESAIASWLSSKPKMDVCIHTAALSSPRVCQDEPEKANAMNVPNHLFERLQAQGCRIIALSTDQVYDGNHAPYLETDDPKPVNVYGSTKLAMEKYLRKLTNDQVVILRSSIILGKKAPISTAHDTFLHFCAGREGTPTNFYTDERRSVIFIQDVVDTIIWFLQNSESGVYNMGGPASVSRVDMAKAVFHHLAYDPSSIRALEKANLPSGPVPSPLDISMDSSKLQNLLKKEFATMDTIVQATFPR